MENVFIILFGFTMLYIAATSRLAAHVNVLVVQGMLLFLICVFGMNEFSLLNFLFIATETLIIKSIVIPAFLGGLIKRTKEYRDTEANIHHFYSLFITTVILFGGFLFSNLDLPSMKLINPLYLGVSISVIIISLMLITIKHKVISNVIDFITMENGIFLLSLSVAKEMPMMVSLGVLLDLFIAVFILGLLVKHINTKFDDMEVSHLSDLRDCEYVD